MAAQPSPLEFELGRRATAPDRRDLLRFIACGSVDDGKSTLIGRLLYDSRQLLDDQISALAAASARAGRPDDGLDLALALDGLAAEREQGITIDVAYRFFSTDRRSFIVADTPGHEQYTRNMATGASTADAAVLLVDVRKGLSRQTRRHSLLLSVLGIRHVVLAVNKMDLVGWSHDAFADLEAEYRAFARELGFATVTAIPMAAKHGDNVARPSAFTPWYRGPDLLSHLEGLDVDTPDADGSFRLAVQWVNRPDAGFRGFAGLVSAGAVRPGDQVTVLPSGERTRIARIVTCDGDLEVALPGQAVTVTLANEVDVSRGCVIAAVNTPARCTDQVQARLFWMAKEVLRQGASYLAKVGTQTVPVTVATIAARIDLDTLQSETASGLSPNDVGDVTLLFHQLVTVEAFAVNRDLGTLILIDREGFDTVAMGLVLEDAEAGAATPAASNARAESSWSPDILLWLPGGFASRARSALKIASWRLIGTVLTVVAAYVLTRDPSIALLLGVFEFLVKSLLQFGHERLWTHLGFGLRFLAADSTRISPDNPAKG